VKLSPLSFISLSIQTFKLLPKDQHAKIVRNSAFSIALAILEVLSLAIIFPLLQFLLADVKSSPNTFILKNFTFPTETFHWTTLLTMIVCLYVFKNSFALWQMHNQSQFLDQLYVKFAKRIYHRFYQQSWTDYTKENSTESFRKIKNTAYEFTHNVLYSYLTLLPEALICILMVGVIVWIDYRILFILALLFLPTLVFYAFFKKKVILKIDKSFRELTPQANIILAQGIDGFAEARIYQKENYFIYHFIAISKITTKLLSRLKTFIILPSRLVETVSILCFAGIIIYGKLFPDTRQSLLVFLVMLSLVIYRIIPSMNRILINVSQIHAYAYAVSELQKILKIVPGDTSFKKQEIAFNQKIDVKSVSFQYDTKSNFFLLKDVTVKIEKGDFAVLEGASGSGKTTFMHLLAGLIHDYSGKILIDETLLTAGTFSSWQAKLGFVPQAPIILQDTILRNVAFGLEDDEVVVSRVNEVLQFTGLKDLINSFPLKLDTPVGENGLTLSGGQRQRLILARALYRNPEVLLLDEVTNQLDEESKLWILKNLQLLAKQGKTILLISHDPLTKKFSNRVLHLENMQIVESTVIKSSPIS
jgi:ATP-binding cassette, subfamily B, bacterial PglK